MCICLCVRVCARVCVLVCGTRARVHDITCSAVACAAFTAFLLFPALALAACTTARLSASRAAISVSWRAWQVVGLKAVQIVQELGLLLVGEDARKGQIMFPHQVQDILF